MKNKIITGMVVLTAIALISGASIVAFASPGSQSDPFITLSYLMDKFKPQIMDEVGKTEQELTDKFNERIDALESEIKNNQGGSAAPNAADTFSVVTLSKNQTLTCSVGAEVMLRVGTATGFGTAPALVDTTNGATLSSGSNLSTNHMYLVTLEGNGVKAASDTVRVLIRGSYKTS